MESGDTANVPRTTTPDDSLESPQMTSINSVANDNILEESSTAVQILEKTATSPLMPSEALKMDDVLSQPNQEQNGCHSAQHIKMPDPFLEQPKADTSSPFPHSEDGSPCEGNGETPEAISEPQSLAHHSEQLVQGEEDRSHPCHDKDPSISFVLKQLEYPDTPSELGQEEKRTPSVHHAETSEVSSEQQESASTSSQLGMLKDSSIVDCHAQPHVVRSDSLEQAESESSPQQSTCNAEISQASCGIVASSNPPSLLFLKANIPSQPQEGDRSDFVGHQLSSAPLTESEGTLKADNINEDINLNQETTATGEEERDPNGLGHSSLAAEKDLDKMNGQLLSESQATEDQTAQDTDGTLASPSQALADPESDVDTCLQQRAAGTGSDTVPEAVPMLSPVATSDSYGPAYQGLAPVCDGQNREGLAVHESSEASDNKPQSEVDAKAVLESEKAIGNAEPEETTGEPQGANKDPAGANILAKETPELEILTNTSNPSGPKEPASTMVLAGAEDPCGARDTMDSQTLASTEYPMAPTEQTGPEPTEGLLIHAEDQASPEHLVSAAEPVYATPVSDEFTVASGSDIPPNWMENAADTLETTTPPNETPIEREIRLHLEREELLRRERGLASPRVTQEYVEVRIRPILNQSVSSSSLPKDKERQWAGVQMQREIQRECRREDDLVQLGKVRGAYDRGTPQEVQEKKMLFEQHSGLEPPASRKIASSGMEGVKGPSFAEANSTTNVVIVDSGAVLQSQGTTPERIRIANPFFCLRSKSSQSLVEQEVQEAQERERELQRQRYNLYGSMLPSQPTESSDLEEEPPTQPERPSCKKLDFTWPPPSHSESSQVNGHQLEKSPRLLRRQKSALIQRWESGAIGNTDSEE